MNKRQRPVLTIGLVLLMLIVGTIAMPLSAAADGRQQAQHQSLPGVLWEGQFRGGRWGQWQSWFGVFSLSERGSDVSLGPVRLVVPAGAMPRSGPVVMSVVAKGDTITVDLTPDYRFTRSVYLGFEGDLVGAAQVDRSGNPIATLSEVPPPDGSQGYKGYTWFAIDHFSRYSGWF